MLAPCKLPRIVAGIFLYAVVAGGLTLTPGCGMMKGGPKPTTTIQEVVSKQVVANEAIQKINERLFSELTPAAPVSDMILGEGDYIQVTVFEAPELWTEARVGARGFITLPLIGPVQVKGLTLRAAETRIEDLYRQKFLQNPHVGIFLREQVAGKIVVMGALKEPGTFPYLTRTRLFDALAMAKGLSEKAGRMVQIRRFAAEADQPNTFLIDLDDLTRRNALELNVEIRGGDVIYVPEAGNVYVDGAVRKPGSYPLTKSMTVPAALAAAGGLTIIASEGDIKLVRYSDESGKREVVQLAMKDIEQGGAAADIEVKDRDVLFVETSIAKSLVYGLRLNLAGGLFGVGYVPVSGYGYSY